VVVVVRGVTGSHATGPAPFAKSCTTPAFELSTTQVRPGQSVSARVTGPVGEAYLLALDATTVTARTGSVVLVPPTAPDLLAAATLPGCEQTTGFLIPATTAPGQHRVGLFRTRPGDSGGPVQTVTITVS
jgi:hypothetical protein